MIFNKCKLNGAYVIDFEKNEDERGFFANVFNNEFFDKCDLKTKLIECNISFNKKKGTLRGLHYQLPPYQGSKLVRCTRGKIFDVILDLRPTSQTFKQWISTELSADNYKMNFVPQGCAHGFQTLEDNSEVLYLMFEEYMPEYSRVVFWNDDEFRINWPLAPTVISKRDEMAATKN